MSQRNDIAMAITKFDQFDFLIDIVPRDELKPPKRQVRNTATHTHTHTVEHLQNVEPLHVRIRKPEKDQGAMGTSAARWRCKHP